MNDVADGNVCDDDAAAVDRLQEAVAAAVKVRSALNFADAGDIHGPVAARWSAEDVAEALPVSAASHSSALQHGVYLLLILLSGSSAAIRRPAVLPAALFRALQGIWGQRTVHYISPCCRMGMWLIMLKAS